MIQGEGSKFWGLVVSVIVRKTVSMDMCHSERSPRYVQDFLDLQIKSVLSGNTETEITCC